MNDTKKQTKEELKNIVQEHKELILKRFKNGNNNSVYGWLPEKQEQRLDELSTILKDNNIIYMKSCLITYRKPYDYKLCHECGKRTEKRKICEECIRKMR